MSESNLDPDLNTIRDEIAQEVFFLTGEHIKYAVPPVRDEGKVDYEKLRSMSFSALSELEEITVRKESLKKSQDKTNFSEEPSSSSSTARASKNDVEQSSSVKYDYFNTKPAHSEQSDSDSEGSYEVDYDEEDEDIKPDFESLSNDAALNSNKLRNKTARSTLPTTADEIDSDCEEGELENGPVRKIQHVREQIRSTKEEIANLEKMMSKISDLRHVLSETGKAGADLNKLKELSLVDFREFQAILANLPSVQKDDDAEAVSKAAPEGGSK